jgi:hypothetical protein
MRSHQSEGSLLPGVHLQGGGGVLQMPDPEHILSNTPTLHCGSAPPHLQQREQGAVDAAGQAHHVAVPWPSILRVQPAHAKPSGAELAEVGVRKLPAAVTGAGVVRGRGEGKGGANSITPNRGWLLRSLLLGQADADRAVG